MPAREDIHSILIIGSGPIVIGQACEFDYSGTQAVHALKEEGYRIILVNPNPATVMTTPGIADAIYAEPLSAEYVREIIRQERPDAVLPTMGGQTALNLAIELHAAGSFEEFGVEMIGATIDSIQLAEDRGRFKSLAYELGIDVPHSELIEALESALRFKQESGLPVIIRPSYTLGGQGGSIAETDEEFEDLISNALAVSPVHQALVEESLIGWKEYELELVRDKADNTAVICSIENIDPMGVHTGDSITVAPAQTLSDREYQRMRSAAMDIMRRVGVDCGGSNVQFAVDPDSGRMIVIEMNPRVSRSSALASKATGFPIARCSAKLAVGYTLDEIINEITGRTVSSFEPALDYCAVKVPRFELKKFPHGHTQLGTQMKSVGEALAIGRTFGEALNKAVCAAEIGYEGLEELGIGYDGLDKMLETAHPLRLWAAYTVIRREGQRAIAKLSEKTGFTPWVLHHLCEIADVEDEIAATSGAASAPGGSANDGPGQAAPGYELLMKAKRIGLTDRRIARLAGLAPAELGELRCSLKLQPAYHLVDTCAGEFSAETPYFYSTYGEIDEGEPLGSQAVLIIGSGPNRIGQGVEFDTGCTLASLAYRRRGIKAVMLNSNPETVSTDFNISDRLYIEPVHPEYVQAVLRKEGIRKVVVQLGGQTPLNIAEELAGSGIEVVGTSVESIQSTEDRQKFSGLMSSLGIRQPRNLTAFSAKEVRAHAGQIGYPVLLRPSFVLGGQSMNVAFTEQELELLLHTQLEVDAAHPVLVDQFLEDAFEYDLDLLCDGENVYIAGLMQHIESAGVHSGDSACVFPAYKTSRQKNEEMYRTAAEIARALRVSGFLNIQFAVKEDRLYVIEVNPRASRTIPFLAKASGVNLVDAAVHVWNGGTLDELGLCKDGFGVGQPLEKWAVKEAVFSFERFDRVDPLLSPEMKSTGEVMGSGDSLGEAFIKAQAAAGSRLPQEGNIFVSVHDKDKATILPIVQELSEMGFHILATRGTAEYLFKNGVFPEVVLKVHEGRPHLVDYLRSGKVQAIINTPMGQFSQHDDEQLRIAAVKLRIPYTTTTTAAWATLQGIRYARADERIVRPLHSSGQFTLEK
ncbi:MAG: carbamoyl-phosphate synthase large subunit [bacterium]